MTTTSSDKRARFRALHREGCFALPNPWDLGSARLLEELGFVALASTSAGFAWSRARPDGAVPLELVLTHLRELCAATSLPVNADFESGFAEDAEGVARHVRLALEAGVAGLSIEDASGDPSAPLRPIEEAARRLRAARGAMDEVDRDAILVGRAENFLVGRPDLDDTIRRLRAYAEAGADCLFAPGIHTKEQISAIVTALAPRPINVLVGSNGEHSIASLGALGVRRVSVGGGLARSAWGAFERAARALRDGRLDGFGEQKAHGELNAAFSRRPG